MGVAEPSTVGVGVSVGVAVGGTGVYVGMKLGVLVGGKGRMVPMGVWIATAVPGAGVNVAGKPPGTIARLARVGIAFD